MHRMPISFSRERLPCVPVDVLWRHATLYCSLHCSLKEAAWHSSVCTHLLHVIHALQLVHGAFQDGLGYTRYAEHMPPAFVFFWTGVFALFCLFVCLLEENTSDVIGNCVLLCVAGRLPSVALLCCQLSNFVAIFSNFSSNCSNFFWCPWRLLSSQMWNQVSFPSLPAHCLLFLSYPQAVRWFYSLTSFHCHTTLQCPLQWWVWLILQI